MSPDSPVQLGPYRVLDQIGSGGMGAVYRALDPRLQREVAIKVLHRNLQVPGASERFLQEARTISSLNHPNICTVFDIGEQEGDPYLVMELLQGEALKDRMLRGPMPEGDLREIAFRVALALQAAHGKGVIHRDIKPANIFLVADGAGTVDVKVLDFGLAKLEREVDVARASRRGITRAGATVGTVEYMSPEQACGEELDARTDLFSLGAVLYEMATGNLPFPGATSAIVFAALLNQEPVAPRDGNLKLSTDLDSIIRHLLVKNRSERTHSATALLEALSAENRTDGGEEGRIGDTRRRLLSSTVPRASADTNAFGPASSNGSGAKQCETRPISRAPRPFPTSTPRSKEPESGASPGSDSRAAKAPARFATPSRSTSLSEPFTEPVDPTAANRKRRTGEVLRSGSGPYRIAGSADTVVVAKDWQAFSPPRSPTLVLLLLLIVGGIAAAWLGLHSRNGASHRPTIRGSVQILPISNQIGGRSLDKASTELLQLLLAESPLLTVRQPAASDVLEGGSDATSARIEKFVQAHRATASQDGADDLITASGSLSRSDRGLLVHLVVKRAVSDSVVADAEGSAASAAEIPAVLPGVVEKLRSQMGEDAASIRENSGSIATGGGNPLQGETLLSALAADAEGEAEVETGDAARALAAFGAAVQSAPAFLPARLHAAGVLLGLHADGDARIALAEIASTPAAGGPHLRSERDYVLAQRDGPEQALQAAERWRASRPADSDAQAAAAEQLLCAGRAKDAVAAANTAVQLDPFRRRNQDLKTRAELENGQPETAWTTQTAAFNAGLGSPGLSLAAAVLKNNRGQTTAALSRLQVDQPDFQELLADAVYRANTGDMAGAVSGFQRAGTRADKIEGAASAASYTAALNRWNLALAGECPSGYATKADVGEAAVLEWMTAAWCHLPAPVQASPLTDARAVAARLWLAGDKAGALTALSSVHAPDALLLRARLAILMGRTDAAIADGRSVVERRGAAYLSGGISYPAALALLTASYRVRGDVANAETEQAALREVWQSPAAVARLLQVSAVQR